MFNLFRRSKPVVSGAKTFVNADGSATVERREKVRVNGAIPNTDVAPQKILDSEELPDFERKLYDEMNMQPSTRHIVCPVLVDMKGTGGKGRFAMIVLEGERHSDYVAVLAKKVAFKYEMASPFFYTASNTVLIELARESSVSNKRERQDKDIKLAPESSSRLWKLFEDLVSFIQANEGSDIHLIIEREKSHSQIKFRIDGILTSPTQFRLSTHDVLDMAAYLYNTKGLSGTDVTFNEGKPQACQIKARINSKKLLFRWASNQTATGTKVVLRMLNQDEGSTVKTLSQLGYLPGQIILWNRAVTRLGGGILLAGVVGSGKSTTMQTVMCVLLGPLMAKYTVEDPVEYLMPGVDQFSVSRAMTSSKDDVDPFLAVKRQLKRMDPDAVLIGEIRDADSAALFRDIAESGHRALATVHAPSAIDMVTLRLVSDELGIPRDVIATPGFINLLVYQALVPKVCDGCNKPIAEVYEPEYIDRIKKLFNLDMSKVRAKNKSGCPKCVRPSLPELNGTRGRLVVAEMIELDSIMLGLIRDKKNMELVEYWRGTRNGKAFSDPDTTGKTALEVAMYHVSRGVLDPKDVEAKLGSFEQYANDRR